MPASLSRLHNGCNVTGRQGTLPAGGVPFGPRLVLVLKNPFYAGVYVYGKTEKRTEIIEGRARKSYGHGKPIGTWEVMIKDHHEGYINWAEYERNQKQLAINTYGTS